MSRKEIYEQKTESFIQPIVDKYHFELVDVEYVKEYLEEYNHSPSHVLENQNLD